jgi:group I intron endonuclease
MSTIIYSIYKITNLVNNKLYIGYTKNIKYRFGKHKEDSKKKDFILYRAIRKHGWENFKHEIIYQSYSLSHIKEMEKHFIQEYNTYIGNKKSNGYNMTLGGDTHSFLSIKFYEFIDPNGNYISGHNLLEFCAINDLRYDTMKNVLVGKRISHKGYRNVKFPDYIQPGNRVYVVYDKDNNRIEFTNMGQFAREHNLSEPDFQKVVAKKKKSYKGYKYDPDYTPRNARTYKLINPKGEVVTFNSIRNFCYIFGLDESNISMLLSGKIKSSKGYRNYK